MKTALTKRAVSLLYITNTYCLAMKRKLLYSLGLLLSVAAVSCDKDNDPAISPISDKTYSGLTALDIEYNGAPMVGKTVEYTQDGLSATLNFHSIVSLSSLSPELAEFPDFPGPGVLPGSPRLECPVTLHPDGDEYEFTGTGETDYVTYSYSGEVKADKLDFEFKDVRLKNRRLANTVWKPAPLIAGKDGASYSSMPFHVVWETDQPGLLAGFDYSVQDAVNLLLTLPIIPAYNNTAYMSVSQALASGVRALAFNPDGNAVVTYLKTANGAAEFSQAPLCMLQYLPLSNSMMKVFVNPTDLMGVILTNINNSQKPDIPEHPFGAPATRASIQEISGMLSSILPLVSEGFPLQYDLSDSSLKIYFNSETLIPLLKGVIIPLLADPIIQQSILERLQENPSLQPYKPIIEAFLIATPLILESTTKVELGVNLIKY